MENCSTTDLGTIQSGLVTAGAAVCHGCKDFVLIYGSHPLSVELQRHSLQAYYGLNGRWPHGRVAVVQRDPLGQERPIAFWGRLVTCPQVVELWVCSLNQSLPGHEGAIHAGYRVGLGYLLGLRVSSTDCNRRWQWQDRSGSERRIYSRDAYNRSWCQEHQGEDRHGNRHSSSVVSDCCNGCYTQPVAYLACQRLHSYQAQVAVQGHLPMTTGRDVIERPLPFEAGKRSFHALSLQVPPCPCTHGWA